MANSTDSIQILQNQIVIDTIHKFSNHSHLTCVHEFNAQNDIFELRTQGSGEVSKFLLLKFLIVVLILNFHYKATISVKIINEGIPLTIKFGKNRDLNFITMSEINTTCDENFEIARAVFIRNGQIMKSECVRNERLLVLTTRQLSNIPKMIFYPGEHFIPFKKLKFNFQIQFFNFCNLNTFFLFRSQ